MDKAIQLREQLLDLIDKLFLLPTYGEDPEIQNTIEEIKEFRREIMNCIKKPKRFDSNYFSSIKAELNVVVANARRLLHLSEDVVSE